MVKIEGFLSTNQSTQTTYKVIGAVVLVALAALATLVALGCCCAWSNEKDTQLKEGLARQQEKLTQTQDKIRKALNNVEKAQAILNDPKIEPTDHNGRYKEALELIRNLTRFPFLCDLQLNNAQNNQPYACIMLQLFLKPSEYARETITKEKLIEYIEEVKYQLDRQKILMNLIPDSYKCADKTDLLTHTDGRNMIGIQIGILDTLREIREKYVFEKTLDRDALESQVQAAFIGASDHPSQPLEILPERAENQPSRHESFMQNIPDAYKNETGTDFISFKANPSEAATLGDLRTTYNLYVLEKKLDLDEVKTSIEIILGES